MKGSSGSGQEYLACHAAYGFKACSCKTQRIFSGTSTDLSLHTPTGVPGGSK